MKGLRSRIVEILAGRIGVAPSTIDATERFQRLGLTSLSAGAMLAELGAELGRALSPTLVWEYPTPEALARYLAGSEAPVRAAATAPRAGRADGEPIAIVGMACRFPQAASPRAFWDLLQNGVDAITEVPPDRWNVDAFYDPDPAAPGKMSTRWGGFLDHVDRFDPQFFGISPREAVHIDPQQRLTLELAWEALEDAGIPPLGLEGSATGVFVGAMWMDYARLSAGAPEQITQYTATGQDLSIVPARVSYTLGLAGPSVAVNTACSSSLSAVHLACESLRLGESRLALAGGVNLLLAPDSTIAMSKFGAMAPDGRSKAFDARANGYVRGEGGGVVVLKRLSDALADGDRVYCVIRGSAANNDGFSNGLTAPNPAAQEAVLREACAVAGVSPADVQNVEAHGTGTMLGDPIEAGALGAVLGMGRPAPRALRIGSVKTNIGHLEAAAGMAGLIKVALSMQHQALPPSLHYQEPNPHIPFDALRLRVQAEIAPWESEEGRLLAGVSSFGFGGTNVHVVLERRVAERPWLFAASAESETDLRAQARRLASALPREVRTAEAAHERGTFRLAVAVRSRAELGRHLAAFADGQALPGLAAGRIAGPRPRVAFVFGGQGSQWHGMGRALLDEEPVARAMLEQCDLALRAHVPWSLVDRLRRGGADLFDQTDFVQPAIFSMQMALATAWRARGVEPSAVVGQSMGEVAAACVAGALSLEDAACIICRRSQLVARAAGKGQMALLALPLSAAADAIAAYGGRLSVAVSSSPETTVIAGDDVALHEVLATLEGQGVFCRPVRVDYASHSPAMDPLLPELTRLLAGVAPRREDIAFYSTVLGAPLHGAALDGAYWARNLREPVLFAPTIARLAADGVDVLVEVDPHAVLVQAVEQCLARGGHRAIAVASARRDEPEVETLIEASGRLWVAGVPTQARSASAAKAEHATARLVPLSAKSEAALGALSGRLLDHLEAHPDVTLDDVAYSLATTRSPMDHRLAIAATSRETLRAALEAATAEQTSAGAVRGRLSPGGVPKVVFVFPGQGSQWLGMGRQLSTSEPVFRAALSACDQAIQAEAGFSLLTELAADEATSQLGRIDVAQPVLFALEVALAALWRSWGVEPDAVVGHSMGEVAAAHVAGALSLVDAAAIICRRSRLLRRISGQGEMAVVELSFSEAASALGGYEDRLSVAASNSPRSTVLSGEPSALSEVLASLEAKGVFCRRVKVDVASHSPQVDPLRDDLMAVLAELQPMSAMVPMRSTVTGAMVVGPELDAGYWAENLRKPVRFARAVEDLLEDGHGLFVEMSPHPILTTSIEEIRRAAARRGAVVGSLRRGHDERPALLEALGALWVQGHPVVWSRLVPEGGRRVPLPTYPWQHERYWLDMPSPRAAVEGRHRHAGGHPLLGEAQSLSTQANTRLWETTLDLQRLPWLTDHRVRGAAVFPGAAYLEMAISSGAEALGEGTLEIADVVLPQALVITNDAAVSLQTVTTEESPGRLRFQIASRAPGSGNASWQVHARGALRRTGGPEVAAKLNVAALRAGLEACASVESTYAALAAMGLEYGPGFRGMIELWQGEAEALGRVRLPETAGSAAGYRLHPALLDACLQVVLSSPSFAMSGETTPWVPVELGSLRLFQRPSGVLWCYARSASPEGPGSARRSADVWVVDGKGHAVLEASGLVLQRLSTSAHRREEDDWFLELAWESAAVPAPSARAGRWLLLGGGDLGTTLCARLVSAGHAAVHASARDTSAASVRAILSDAFDGQAPTALVHLGSLDGSGELDADAAEAALKHGCDSVLATVQAVASMGFRDAPRLWLSTRGAQAVDGRGVAAVHAPLLGLGRVIAMEHAELRCCRIDLDPSTPADEVDALLAELLADDAEEEVALRDGERRVARLIHRVPEAERRERLEPAGKRPFRLEIDEPGVLDRLVLRAMERRAPGPGEVEIAVAAAGLNFIDVMKAMGIYPGLSAGPVALGGECAGRIVAIGEGVAGVHLGQDVVALAPSCFTTHVTIDARRVVPRPAALSVEQAAALPLVFMTAWYGLVHLGRLQAGERVLIHSATGGTGLAALQIARHLGAEIFATAGTPEKRAWLHEQGVAHVMDSRSLDFAEQIMAATGGQGVDVVLNSLSGDAIDASLSTLAPDGRFIELGKTDIYADRPVRGAHFKKSLSYSAVDLAGLGERRPQRFAALFAEVMRLLSQGALRPVPVETFPASRAADAFRKMAQAQHLGKLVLVFEDPEARIRVPAPSRAPIRADGSYLVTGGLGGLGLRVAAWLGEQGAGHLVLLGRSGAVTPEQQAAVAALDARGARVTVVTADVSDRAQLERVLRDVAASGMPLRGLVHAAGLLDDGLLVQQTPARFRAVMAPKVEGALHLHALTREMPLDFFVLYSSVAGLLGSPGQGNYAAANTFLDALAHHRIAEGLPALSIDWGAFSEVGLAAAQENRGERLVSRGMRSLTPEEGLSALVRLLDADRVQAGVVPLDVRQWVEFYPAMASSRMLSRLVTAQRMGPDRNAGDRSLLDRMASAEPGARAHLMQEAVREQVSQVLRIPEGRLDVDAPLTSLGMDSLMGLELRNRIEATLGITVAAALLWTYPTIAALSEYLADATTAAASPPYDTHDHPEIDEMSSDDLMRLISEKFEALP